MSKIEIIHLDEKQQQDMLNECVRILSDESTHIKEDSTGVYVMDVNGNNKFSLEMSPAMAVVCIDHDHFLIELPSNVAKLIEALKSCKLKQTHAKNSVVFNKAMNILRGGNEKH